MTGLKSCVERSESLIRMPSSHVTLQRKHSGWSIWTMGTLVRFFPRVCSNVCLKVSFPRTTVWAMGTNKWLLSSVDIYVPFETWQNTARIFTVGTLVHPDVTRAGPGLLGGRCSRPVFTAVQPHLQRCPAYFRLLEFMNYNTVPPLLFNRDNYYRYLTNSVPMW